MRTESDGQGGARLFEIFENAANPETSAKKSKRPSPVTLRLSPAERSRLERDAGVETISAYIRARLFGDDVSPRRKMCKPVADHVALGRVLAALGQSHLANNVNQIAKAVNTGTLVIGPETDDRIRQACADIAAMRRDLMVALGLSVKRP